MGTPDFISPEQAEDARKVDIRSDIYSLGATLYYLLSGRVPFADGSVMHKLKSHAQFEPEPLDSLRADIPQEVMEIVTKMMAKDPEERYLTPRDVADALESFLRNWEPGEAESGLRATSSGGDMSVSGGPKTDPDGMTPNWLSVWAKWFFYLSLLPIAILFIDLLVLSDETSVAAADRLMWYVLASIGLSSIAGVLTGVNQAQTSAAGGRRIYRLTTEQAVLIAAFLIGAAAVYYVATNNGVVRVEVNDPTLTVSIQGETITLTEGDKQPLTIRPGDQTLVVRKVDAGLEFETDRFQIRRGDEIAFKVELLEGEIVVRKDGEKFHATTLPEEIDFAQQIFERMTKVYAECKSYTDTGVIEAVVRETPDSPNVIIDHSFTTAFVRPGRIRFEIENEDKETLLISANEGNIQTWWDLEPGIRKPASLDLAFAEALGFAGGNVGHIPALLMPQTLEVWEASLQVVEPKRMYERKLENVECHCLEFKFDEQRTVLWIDKQSYLIRRIEQWINSEGIYADWRTTFVPTINGNVTEQMLEFDPPAPRAADDSANTLREEELKQLQGNWESVSLTEGGKQLAIENGFGGALLQIKGNTFVIGEKKPNGEKSEVDTGQIEIDSTTTPKTIDFIGRAQLTIGIYEFEDGVLRICLVEQGGTDAPAGERIPATKPLKRPTTFDSPAGSNMMLMEFTRKEPAKENDIPNIQGTWQVTYSEDGGRIAPQEMLKELRFVIGEQNLTTEIGGQKSISTYKLDPSTNPKSIDLTENGRMKQAIYDLVGDTLRICIAESGEQRPTAFDSQPNSANDIVLILKRVKPDNASADGTEDQKHNGPLSEELARSLIPTAASISNEDFQKLQTNPAAQTIKNKSLSLVLMTLDIGDQSPEAANDFRFLVEGYPQPNEIAAAMSPSRSKGYFSFIQPGYITECKITNSTDEIAQGKVTFNAPKLYIGSVTFEARKHEGTWRIEKFHLPSRQISIELGEDGNWHPEGKEAEGNQAPAPSHSTPNETPES